ncbi:MAG: flagellar hook-basal body complex protein, partial [bacterium]
GDGYNYAFSTGVGTALSLGVWTGYTEGGTVRHILGTQTLTIDGNVWREVGATTGFTGAANEYILTAAAGSVPVVLFNQAAGLEPANNADLTFQFRPNSTALNLLDPATAYTLNAATGLVTLNWDSDAATAELSGAVAYTGMVRFTANYTTEDRAMSAPASIMHNRWADFAQERTAVAQGGSGKDRTDFINMFAGTGLIGAGNWIDNQAAGGTAPYNTSLRLGSAYVYRTSVTVFDSIGDDHELQFIFTHVGSNYDIDQAKRYENRWYWRAELPYEDVFGFDSMDDINAANITTRLNGQLEFDENGLIQKDLLNGNDGPIEFDPSPIGLNGVSTRAIGTASITVDFDGDDVDAENGILREGVTQMASPSTTHVFEQNGWEMGILETFSIDMQGIFEGRYSNNVVRPLAQIALAMFPNEEGLFKEGDNTFGLSANSGLASVQPATVGARGYVVGGSLEQSNVDITTEFTNMIITERGFQANSRVITTSDEMLTEVLNLKR